MTLSRSLPRSTLLAYAVPGLVVAIPTIPVTVYLPAFYADHLGLGLTTVGLVLLIARLGDTLTDPAIGLLSDGWQSPHGKRREAEQ